MMEKIDNKTEEWLDTSYKKGLDIIKWYLGDDIKNLTPEMLDKAFIKWKDDNTENKAPNDWIIDGLGTLFGKYIIQNINGKWVIENHLGKHLIILTDLGTKIYPIHSVSKRVYSLDDEINFFSSIWKVLKQNNNLK